MTRKRKDNVPLFFPASVKRFVAKQVQGLVTTLTLNSSPTESSVWSKSLEIAEIIRVALVMIENDDTAFAYINSLEWAFPAVRFTVIVIDNYTLDDLDEDSYRRNQSYSGLNLNRTYEFSVEFTRHGNVQLWYGDRLFKLNSEKPKPKLSVMQQFLKL